MRNEIAPIGMDTALLVRKGKLRSRGAQHILVHHHQAIGLAHIESSEGLSG